MIACKRRPHTRAEGWVALLIHAQPLADETGNAQARERKLTVNGR